MEAGNPKKRTRGADDAASLAEQSIPGNLGNSHSITEPRGAINAAFSERRRALLNTELERLGLDVTAVDEGQALKVYNTFVHPREKNLQKAESEPQVPAAKRAANQVAFHVKQHRAQNAEFLRNTDHAQSERTQRGIELHPLVLVLDNVRSAYNVGNILRTAETAAVLRVVCCGLTPTPPHDKIKKTAFSAAETVPTVHYDSAVEAVRALQSDGFTVLAMETTSKSRSYVDVTYPSKTALVLGNEVSGVDTAVIDVCDGLIEIPTFGLKNSLCVSAACPIVVFEVLRQWTKSEKDDRHDLNQK